MHHAGLKRSVFDVHDSGYCPTCCPTLRGKQHDRQQLLPCLVCCMCGGGGGHWAAGCSACWCYILANPCVSVLSTAAFVVLDSCSTEIERIVPPASRHAAHAAHAAHARARIEATMRRLWSLADQQQCAMLVCWPSQPQSLCCACCCSCIKRAR
jgi:hypothetical protein